MIFFVTVLRVLPIPQEPNRKSAEILRMMIMLIILNFRAWGQGMRCAVDFYTTVTGLGPGFEGFKLPSHENPEDRKTRNPKVLIPKIVNPTILHPKASTPRPETPKSLPLKSTTLNS